MSHFKIIDEQLFKLVDEIRGLPFMRKITDELQSLPESAQKLVNQGFTFGLIFIPLGLTSFLLWKNLELKRDISLKEKIIELAYQNNQQKIQLGQIGRTLISPTPLSSSADLQRIIAAALSARRVTPSSVTITHFDSFNAGGDIVQSVATLNFSELATQDFTSLLTDLMQRHQMKVEALAVEKHPTTKFLQGTFEIMHFSRSSGEE